MIFNDYSGKLRENPRALDSKPVAFRMVGMPYHLFTGDSCEAWLLNRVSLTANKQTSKHDTQAGVRLRRHFQPALLFLAGNYRLLATSVVLIQRAQLLIPLWFGFCFYVDNKLILCGLDFTSRNHYVWGKSDWRKQNDTFRVFVLRSFNLMLVIAVCVLFLMGNICDVNWRKK